MSEQDSSDRGTETSWVRPREQQLADKATDVVLELARPALRGVLIKAFGVAGRLRDAVVDRLTS